ncbi:unnamed protein product, partial [Rotaria sp. Silwood1]
RDVSSPKLFYLAVGFKSEKLVRRCQIAYRLTKNGKFQEDLAKDNEKRSCELAIDFTHLQLQPIHKIMTLKFALNQAL